MVIADLRFVVALSFFNFRIFRITVKVIHRFHRFGEFHSFPVFDRDGCLGMVRRGSVETHGDQIRQAFFEIVLDERPDIPGKLVDIGHGDVRAVIVFRFDIRCVFSGTGDVIVFRRIHFQITGIRILQRQQHAVIRLVVLRDILDIRRNIQRMQPEAFPGPVAGKAVVIGRHVQICRFCNIVSTRNAAGEQLIRRARFGFSLNDVQRRFFDVFAFEHFVHPVIVNLIEAESMGITRMIADKQECVVVVFQHPVIGFHIRIAERLGRSALRYADVRAVVRIAEIVGVDDDWIDAVVAHQPALIYAVFDLIAIQHNADFRFAAGGVFGFRRTDQ